MHEHHPGTTRRAVLRSVPTPVDTTPDTEVWVYDAPPLLDVINALPEPRITDLDALLRDVDQFRATLRRDLTLAATAAEAGETELARWLVCQDQSVRAFESSALGRLDHLADQEQVDQHTAVAGRRSRRMMTAAPFAAAAAFVFAFVGGVVPSSTPEPTDPRTTNVALASYEAFTQLALQGGSASDITAAAERFHDELGSLVDSPLTDPAAVNHAILLLQSERAVLLAGGDSSRELTQVLREADRLVARLRAGLSRRPLPVVAEPIIPQPERREPERKPSSPKPSTAAKPSPSASPRPSPKPSPTATPSPKASEPSPEATQGPGTSPTAGPLPKSPPIG